MISTHYQSSSELSDVEDQGLKKFGKRARSNFTSTGGGIFLGDVDQD
jgi:hypothetical protein